MSKATSLRGKNYEVNFRKGFVLQNSDSMTGMAFISEHQVVYAKRADGSVNSGAALGDIDGYYISSKNKFLRDLLPIENRLPRDLFNYCIEEEDHVFFELTTISGEELGLDPWLYISKKVKFHEQLVAGNAHNLTIARGKHVLVLCFNGADSITVFEPFQRLCEASSIRGVAVYVGSDAVSQWSKDLEIMKLQASVAEAQASAEADRLARARAEAELKDSRASVAADRLALRLAQAELKELRARVGRGNQETTASIFDSRDHKA